LWRGEEAFLSYGQDQNVTSMNPTDVTLLIPVILSKLRDLRVTVVLPPHEDAGLWSFRIGLSLGIVATYPQSQEVRITIGVLTAVPHSPSVLERVNSTNHAEIVFGRIFAFDYGDSNMRAIAMQEIVKYETLSHTFVPSLANLLVVLGTLSGQGDQLAATLMGDLGGRPFRDDEALFLSSHS
jgi:hypothetical protein